MAHKVYFTNRQREVQLPTGLRLLIRRACNAVLQMEGFEGRAEVSVSFVNDAEIAQLNNQYRGRAQPTDVLSFPLGADGHYDANPDTGSLMLGDIVISAQRAVVQAKTYGHSLEREIAFLTVHSMYHLLGYDHEGDDQAAALMRRKEEATLRQLGLPRTVSALDNTH